MLAVTIDIESLYAGSETAKLADLPEYERKAMELAGSGNQVTLTGQGPIWLYLKIAHALHGKVRSLRYDSQVTGEMVVFDHNPFERPEPQRRGERGENLVSNTLTDRILGAAIRVHKALGPGLLESAYQKCHEFEMTKAGLLVETEKLLPITYESVKIDAGYRLDMIVDGKIVIENKTVERILPIHEAQLLTYLKLTGCKVGLIINWNVPVLKDGIKRMVLTF
jgi:GxxExxY protein